MIDDVEALQKLIVRLVDPVPFIDLHQSDLTNDEYRLLLEVCHEVRRREQQTV